MIADFACPGQPTMGLVVVSGAHRDKATISKLQVDQVKALTLL
jgi:hypothetical protein